MPTDGVEQAYGAGHKALYHETVNGQDGDTFDADLASVDHAWAQSPVDGAHTANVSDVTGTTLTIELLDVTDGSAITADEDIDIFAWGDA